MRFEVADLHYFAPTPVGSLRLPSTPPPTIFQGNFEVLSFILRVPRLTP